MSVSTGFAGVFTPRGLGQALGVALVVYVVLVVLSRWREGKYLPQNVGG